MKYASGKVTQGKKWRKAMSGLGDRWVEPFCGGLGAFQQIASSYKRALISDLSPVAKMWEAVRDGWLPDVTPPTKEDIAALKADAFSANPSAQAVYSLHTGSFRGNANGGFSKSDRAKSGLKRLQEVRNVLCSVPTEIRQCDYRETLVECGYGDVVYLDPPYSDANYWIAPPSSPIFNKIEMLELADKAIAKGAIVFISHYSDKLDLNKWRPVEIRIDQSAVYDNGLQTVKSYREYLYVDIRTYYRFDFRGDVERVKKNRRASQSSVRQDLIGLMGFRCEATGKTFLKSQLALAHGTGFEYAKTGDSDPEFCYLVNAMFHAAMDDPTTEIWLANGRWHVGEHLRNEFWAEGAHGELAKRFRKSQPQKK